MALALSIGGAAPSAIAGASHAFVAADAGTFSYNVTLPTAGANRRISANDGGRTDPSVLPSAAAASTSPAFTVL